MLNNPLFFLGLAKYGGYFFVLLVLFFSPEPVSPTALISLILVFLLDGGRRIFLSLSREKLGTATLYFQVLAIAGFAHFFQSGIAVVLYVILITESIIFFSSQLGRMVFFLSVGSFLLVISLAGRLFTGHLINSLVLVFSYGLAYLAVKQAQEKSKAEKARAQLEVSQKKLEEAYSQILKSSKEKERMLLLEERNRLARELHDSMGHNLTGIILNLEIARKMANGKEKQLGQLLEEIQQQARGSLEDIRRAVKALQPVDLEEKGLKTAIRGLGKLFQEMGVEVEMELEEGISVGPEAELLFYRTVQEGFTNALRHGKADRIKVSLRQDPEEGLISLEILDNGVGCEELKTGTGLKGLARRVETLGGKLNFGNRKSGGFFLKVDLGEKGETHGKNQDPGG